MSSTPPVQLQWALNSDIGTAFKLFQSVVEAAATDNVQGQAIIACQEVGTQLSMSKKTKDRVFRDMVPSPSPAKIKFLNATVGFSPKDSAALVATSDAGLRFLSLAAALVPTIGPYPSAQVLEIEFRRTKLQFTERPTVQHVDQLMQALRPRTERCTFMDIVLGYQMMVEGLLIQARRNLGTSQTEPDLVKPKVQNRLLTGVPSPEAVAGLIDIFRQLARIGDSAVTGTTITIEGSAPWILAFTDWCLGVGASIYLKGHQEPLLEQTNPEFLVKVILIDENKTSMDPIRAIIHHHHMDDIVQLLGPVDSRPLRAMVDVDSYASWLLTELDFKRHGNSRYNMWMQGLLSEALKHAIPQILSTT